MRALVIIAFCGIARADVSTPTAATRWSVCEAALDAATVELHDDWGSYADAAVDEAPDQLTMHFDLNVGCMHHGGASVTIEPTSRAAGRWHRTTSSPEPHNECITEKRNGHGVRATLQYCDKNESESSSKDPEPFFRAMRRAADICLRR